MKTFAMKWGRHKAPKQTPGTNPLNELPLAQLYEVWSSCVTENDDHKTDHVLVRIKRFVEEENLNSHPIHLMRALIRFTTTCNDYAFQCTKNSE